MLELLKETFYILVLVSVLAPLMYFLLPRKGSKNFPPGPLGLPLVGYLPLLSKEPFHVLHELSKKYGSVFSVRIGRIQAVVLGDFDAINEAYNKNSTLNRPGRIFKVIPGHLGFISSNGKEWVEQRRYSVRAMRNLGLGKGPWEAAIAEEVADFVRMLETFEGKPVDICQPLTTSVSANIVSLLLGKRVRKGSATDEFLNHCVDAVARYFSRLPLAVTFPRIFKLMLYLKLETLYSDYQDMIAFDDFFRKEVEEREYPEKSQECDNFIDEYLREMRIHTEAGEKASYNVQNLKGNTKSLFLGGSETTRTSLDWLLLAMAAHPHVQGKVHDELCNVLGQRTIAFWEDRTKLPYTYATIMEGQRWRTVLPISVSRMTSEDTKIFGHDVPKGTTIMCNIWGAHNDARYWENPGNFQPERFLKPDGEVNLKPRSYAPFSVGKRNCPGETVALMEILLYFTAIIRRFEIRPEEPGAKVETDGFLGITYQAYPHKLRFICRE